MGGHVNSVWTDEQSEVLVTLLANGKSFSQIAAALNAQFNTNYSRNAVCGKGFRLQVRAPAKPRKAPPLRVRTLPTTTVRRVRHVEEIQLRCVPLDPLHLTLEQLEPSCCRYPFGEGPFTFCGHPQKENSSYCMAHEHLCHGAAPKVSALESLRRRMHWKKLQGLTSVFPLEVAE